MPAGSDDTITKECILGLVDALEAVVSLSAIYSQEKAKVRTTLREVREKAERIDAPRGKTKPPAKA